MSEVAMKIKVFPLEGYDLEKLKANITSSVSPREITEDPIGFGLVALIVLLVVSEEEGEETEKKLKETDGVGQYEVIDVRKLI